MREVLEEREDTNVSECMKAAKAAPDMTREPAGCFSVGANLMPGSFVVGTDPGEESKKQELNEVAMRRFDVVVGSSCDITPPPKRFRSWESVAKEHGSSLDGASSDGASTIGIGSSVSPSPLINLVVVRNKCISESRKMITNCIDKKSCNYKVLKDIIATRFSGEHRDVVALGLPAKINQFEQAADHLKQVGDNAKNWTQKSVMQAARLVWDALEMTRPGVRRLCGSSQKGSKAGAREPDQ